MADKCWRSSRCSTECTNVAAGSEAERVVCDGDGDRRRFLCGGAIP